MNSVNSVYLIVDEVDVCNGEKNCNKYLTLASIGKNKEILTKYTDLWDNIILFSI